MQLWAGLGNPGPKYAGNRHNIGFMAVDRIAQRWRFGPWRKRFSGEVSEGAVPLADGGEARILLLKPQTFMNDSGRSVAEAVKFYKIALGDIVVFYDEIDLAPGRMRMKTGGGAAGHNGIRSVAPAIGAEFRRARLGVGHPGVKELVHHHVLSDFAKSDADWLEALLNAAASAAPMLAAGQDERYQAEVMRLAPAPKSDPRRGPVEKE
jgi:PTH1 family peptidyl-tRNA hydrolase